MVTGNRSWCGVKESASEFELITITPRLFVNLIKYYCSTYKVGI